MLKFHFRRAFSQKKTQILFLVLILINVGLATQGILYQYNIPSNYLLENWTYMITFSDNFLWHNEFLGLYDYLFSVLIACIPYASSYTEDKVNHRLEIIVKRNSTKAYFSAALLVNFIVASLTYFIPRVITQLMYIVAYPLHSLRPGYMRTLRYYSDYLDDLRTFNYLLKNKPQIYAFLTVVIASVFVGIFASVVYAYSLNTDKNKYAVVFYPVVSLMLFEFIVSVLGFKNLGTEIFQEPGSKDNIKNGFVLVYLFLIVIFIGLFIRGMRKNKDIALEN